MPDDMDMPVVANDTDEGSRLDRELSELLQELRVLLPGIQVLFAFLLSVPFTQRFRSLSDFQESVYFVSFVATALASVLLIAPSVQHRLRWRRFDKERLLRASNRLTLGGTVLLGVAIESAVLLVTDFLYDRTTAVVIATTVGVAMLGFWWVSPLVRSAREGARRPS